VTVRGLLDGALAAVEEELEGDDGVKGGSEDEAPEEDGVLGLAEGGEDSGDAAVQKGRRG